ncbi:hypothetical protein D3C77_434700 [compost metagenome]
MNYLDEQILRMKQELTSKPDLETASQFQSTDSVKESLVSGKSMVLRIKDEVVTLAPVTVLDGDGVDR